MKTTSIFKFIITIVMVIFSTTINAQSAQINATTDFSDYTLYSPQTNLINILQSPYGFEYFGSNRHGYLTKQYTSQLLDSVNVSFKVTATYIAANGGSSDFKIRVIAGNVLPNYVDVTGPETQYTYIYNHTFISVQFDSLNVLINSNDINGTAFGGTITVDSLVITGYSQSGSIWTENGTVGIDENVDNVTNFNTYPNPNSGQFKVTFETKSLSTPVMVYDIQGRLVYEDKEDREIGMNTINIDMFNVSSGVYFVKVKNEVFKMQVIK